LKESKAFHWIPQGMSMNNGMGFMDNNIRVNGMEGIKGFNGTFI
jgi:hypothetical protein